MRLLSPWRQDCGPKLHTSWIVSFADFAHGEEWARVCGEVQRTLVRDPAFPFLPFRLTLLPSLALLVVS